MKPRSFALPFVPGEADRLTPPPAHVSEVPQHERKYLRLSPIAAIAVAAAGLALCFEPRMTALVYSSGTRLRSARQKP